jgi:hypothetical protein
MVFQHPGDNSIPGPTNAQRIGQGYGRFERPHFAHLLEPGGLAVTVDSMHRGGKFFIEQVAGMGQDGGHTGVDGRPVGIVVQCNLTDGYAGYIGDRIARAGWQPWRY